MRLEEPDRSKKRERPGPGQAKWCDVFRKGVVPAALWLSSIGAWRVVYVANLRQGGTPAAVRYVVLALCLTLSLALTTPFPAPPLLTVPLLAIMSVKSYPVVGIHGGDIFGFALRTALAMTVVSGIVSYHVKSGSIQSRAVRLITGCQVALLVATLVFMGGFGLMPTVQHRGKRIPVYSLQLQAKKISQDGFHVLSPPLLDGARAFVATEAGVLYEIDLDSGCVVRTMALPLPEPAEAGLPEFVKSPRCWTASHPAESHIARSSPECLSVTYPYHVGRGTAYGWGEAGIWTVEAEVDLTKGETVAWRLVKGGSVPKAIYQSEVHVGEYKAWSGTGFVQVTGAGVETVVYGKPQTWFLLWATERHIVAESDEGRFYVVVPPLR